MLFMTYFELDSSTMVGTSSWLSCDPILDKPEARVESLGSISPWARRQSPCLSAARTPRTSVLSSRSSLSISDLRSIESTAEKLSLRLRGYSMQGRPGESSRTFYPICNAVFFLHVNGISRPFLTIYGMFDDYRSLTCRAEPEQVRLPWLANVHNCDKLAKTSGVKTS